MFDLSELYKAYELLMGQEHPQIEEDLDEQMLQKIKSMQSTTERPTKIDYLSVAFGNSPQQTNNMIASVRKRGIEYYKNKKTKKKAKRQRGGSPGRIENPIVTQVITKSFLSNAKNPSSYDPGHKQIEDTFVNVNLGTKKLFVPENWSPKSGRGVHTDFHG